VNGMSVDLRFSDVDPPAEEPKRTVYADIVNLPDPVKLGLTVRIFNYDDVTLYMKVDGYDSSWSLTSNELGAVGSGGNAYYNLDEFGTRARPASETDDAITVRLRAYTDSGYTNLKWTFERSVHVSFIKSDDGSWTLDELDNFDDGTVQGWSGTGSGDGPPVVATDYVLSPPYSLKMTAWFTSFTLTQYIYKTFSTPDKAKVFAIADSRFSHGAGHSWIHRFSLKVDGVTTLYIGSTAGYPVTAPWNRWMRFVFPLPPNSTPEIRLRLDGQSGSHPWGLYQYLDDFKIISKD